jgi:hypothetical protein
MYFSLLDSLKGIQKLRFELNFGPWDRYNSNKSFISNVIDKPKGAYFYPIGMTEFDFRRFRDKCKYSHFTFIRKTLNEKYTCIPYHVKFKDWIDTVNYFITKAASYSQDSMFAKYLIQLTKDLQTDNYYKSDSIWLKIHPKVDFVFGPVLIDDDKLFNLKAEHQAYVLIEDKVWTQKMKNFSQWLVYLQKALPVPEQYRRENPGSMSEIRVYNAIYYGGSAHAGPPVISITLPLRIYKNIPGFRNMQFKNIIEAKYKALIKPLISIVYVEAQRKYVSQQAFFVNTLLYEMASSLGIRYTIRHRRPVSEALGKNYTCIEYMKNSLLTLYLAEKLHSVGQIPGDLKNYYYTYILDLLRQIRWGVDNNFAKANLIIFNYLFRNDALDFLPTGQIILHYQTMEQDIQDMIRKVIEIEGNGDRVAAEQFINHYKNIPPELKRLLDLIKKNKVPRGIFLNQGLDVLNLK